MKAGQDNLIDASQRKLRPFDERAAGFKQSLFFRFADDSQSRAVFDAATGVEIFQLGKNISGASGDIYARRLLEFLKTTPHEVALTASENALKIGLDESGVDYRNFGFPFYASRDFTAGSVSSR